MPEARARSGDFHSGAGLHPCESHNEPVLSRSIAKAIDQQSKPFLKSDARIGERSCIGEQRERTPFKERSDVKIGRLRRNLENRVWRCSGPAVRQPNE